MRVEYSALRVHLFADTEVCRQHARFAYGPIRQQFPHLHHDGKETRPHRFHEELPALFCTGNHLLRLFGVDGERLFTEYRLSRSQAEDRALLVKGVQRCDVDGIHIGVAHQVFVTSVSARNVEFIRERICSLFRA